MLDYWLYNGGKNIVGLICLENLGFWRAAEISDIAFFPQKKAILINMGQAVKEDQSRVFVVCNMGQKQ